MTPTTLLMRDEVLYEVIDGLRVELPSKAAFASIITTQLACRLAQFVGGRLGRVVMETLFRLTVEGDVERRPDVAFVSYERWPCGHPLPRTEAWHLTPELAVDVIGPWVKAEAFVDKVHEYFRAGVQLVWVVWPTTAEVYVYESVTQIRVLQRTDELDGGTLLAGFRLPVAALFEEELPADGGGPG